MYAANPDIPMVDPRQEATQSFEGVKNTATDMMKLVGALGKMSTMAYMKLLTMRRSQYVESVDSSRVARNIGKFDLRIGECYSKIKCFRLRD